jgi:imidazolonepropionase
MTTVFINIKELYQVREHTSHPLRGAAMGEVPSIKNAYLIVEHARIKEYGTMRDLQPHEISKVIDCADTVILPGYVDSHSHAVFAHTREAEFKDLIKGLTYEEVAARGGGILNSAATLASKSEDSLYEEAIARVMKLVYMGTTTLEIKSGYGLSLEAELKMLQVIARLKQAFSEHGNDTLLTKGATLTITATFLGAHAVPKEYKDNRDAYIELIVNEMIPQVAAANLADFIDVFCEANYFTVGEMLRVIEAGKAHGLRAKLHVNQFNSIGAIPIAVKAGALSVDHLEVMNAADFAALSGAATIATALPSCSFFLGIPYAPVNKMISDNIAVALASDYNPGSCPSGNMNFVFALACVQMKMTPEAALNALTVNAAHALGLQNEVGSITVGKQANLLLFKGIDNLALIPYSFGEMMVSRVMVQGVFIN